MRRCLGLVLICGGCFTDSSADGGTDAASGPTTGDATATTEGEPIDTSSGGATTDAATSLDVSSSTGSTTSGRADSTSDGEDSQWSPELLWLRVFDSEIEVSGDRVDEVVVGPRGEIWVAGAFARDMAPSQMFIARLDANGDVQQTHIYDDAALTNARGLAAANGGFLIGGHTNSDVGGTDRLLTEFRSGGMTFTDPFDFGEPLVGDDIVNAVATDGAQRFAAGVTQVDGAQRAWVQRVLPTGQAWTYTAGDVMGNNRAMEVHRTGQADNSDLLVAGALTDRMGTENAWVARMGTSSTVRWSRTYEAPEGGNSAAQAVVVGESGNLFVVGGVEVPGEGLNAWVQRLSPDTGSEGWYESYDGTGSDDAAAAVAIAANGDVLICGRTTSLEDGADLWVARMSSAGDRRGAFSLDLGEGLDDLITDCVVHEDLLLIAGLGFSSEGTHRDGFVAALSLSRP